MANQTHSLKYTYEDFQLFPDDGRRHEIIDGDHYVTPSPKTKHQLVSSNLFYLIDPFLRRHRLGRLFSAPFDVVLSELDVVEPDLIFLSNQRAHMLTESHIRGAPDLVIEIISESTRRTDEIVKRKTYERYGVVEYWVVDPEVETLKVYRTAGKRYRRVAELTLENRDSLTSSLFPSLVLPLADIFESWPPEITS